MSSARHLALAIARSAVALAFLSQAVACTEQADSSEQADSDSGLADSMIDGGSEDGGRDLPDGGDDPVPPLGAPTSCTTDGVGVHPCYKDVAYAPHGVRTTLDVFLPPASVSSQSSLLVFIHGGGFHSGNKDAASTHVKQYLLHGVAVASIHYRLSDTHPYTPDSTAAPVYMTDSARALQFLRHYAATLGVKPQRVALVGNSAGAGIALWLAFHDDLANPASSDPLARISTRAPCVGPIAGQTSYDVRFIKGLFPDNQVHLDASLLGFYGLTKAQYQAAEASIQNQYAPLFEEASPLFHLDSADASVKVYFEYKLAPGAVDIHSADFGTHAASGTPQVPGFMYKTLQAIGATYVLVHPEDRPTDIALERRLFFEEHCFSL